MAIEAENVRIRQSYPDPFIRNSLPPEEDWPHFINIAPALKCAELNVATELLDKAVDEGFADKVAIFSPGKNWTYGEIYQTANRLANFLLDDCGLIPGNRVLIRSANNPWTVIAWLAIQKAGGVAVTTMAMLRAGEITTIVERAEIRLALCDIKYADELELAVPSCQKHFFGEGGNLAAAIAEKSPEFTNYPAKPTDICLIAFTSGTTGVPKGVMHSHRDVMSVCKSYCDHCLDPLESDILIGTPPLAFAYGIGALLFFPFYARASVILLEDISPDLLASAICEFKATILFTVPTAYKILLEKIGDYDLSSLRKCISAGEALPLEIAENWQQITGLRLLDGIGSTEMLHNFTAATARTPIGSLGKPVPGYEVRIIDEDGQDQPAGTEGRLYVRGPTGCRYLDDVLQKDYVRDGWNSTGDLAMMDADGYLWFRSRADSMIISAGYNIAGPDVEQALLRHEAVLDCGVIGMPDPKRGQIVAAFVVLKDGYPAGDGLIRDLQDFAKSEAAPYKYPRKICFIPALPRTNSGKIQYHRLRQMIAE